jgi:hypothetical protein
MAPVPQIFPQRQLWLHGMIMFADPMKMISTMQILSCKDLKYGTNYYKLSGFPSEV